MLVGVLQVGFYYFPPKNVAIEPFTNGLSCCLTLDFFLGLVLLIASVTERFKEVVIGAFGEACDENVAVDALDVFSVARARTFANMPCIEPTPPFSTTGFGFQPGESPFTTPGNLSCKIFIRVIAFFGPKYIVHQ
jgi:hypothetical protein